MAYELDRLEAGFDPARGILHAEHFQIAYATNDMARALGLFQQRLGISQWHRSTLALPEGGQLEVNLAWLGTVMYELACARGPGSAIYMDRLPAGDGFAMRHHHFGYLIRNQQQWDAMLASAAQAGWPVAHISDTPGLITCCFLDCAELGHYAEFLFPTEVGLKFFRHGVPRNLID